MSREKSAPFRGVSSTFQRVRDFFREEPEDTPLPDVVTKSVNDLEGIFYHIDIFRRHLLRGLIAMIITTAISFVFTPQILDFFTAPIGGIQEMRSIEVTENISVFMRVALLSGFVLALPYIIFELWLFIAPGLHPKTRVFSLLALPAVVLLFLAGAGFAYFVMMPVALPFLLNFMGIPTEVRPASYIKFITGLLFWIGIAFQFPLVIYILSAMGFVKSKMLLEQWRLAVVVIAIMAAAITPTVDPVNMAIVMGPMIILYFLSIGLSKIAERRREKAAT